MPYLKKGSTGPEVSLLQGQLHRLGYDPGPIDGAFGTKTRRAVVAFQRRQELDPDGIVGPLTARELRGALREFVREGDTSPAPVIDGRGVAVPSTGNGEAPLVIDRSVRLNSGEYYRARHRKDLIVLHHTAGGSARSTVNWWNQSPQRIATAYVIERDGTIHEVFDPEYWAYHLGLSGTRGSVDRRSIGIEIACEGGLQGVGDFYYSFDRIIPTTQFTGPRYTHPESWRGYRDYAAYTPEQTASTVALTGHLLERFDIPRRTPRSHLAHSNGHRTYRGVVGHHHLRPDKSDLHPGFAWGDLIRACGLQLTG